MSTSLAAERLNAETVPPSPRRPLTGNILLAANILWAVIIALVVYFFIGEKLARFQGIQSQSMLFPIVEGSGEHLAKYQHFVSVYTLLFDTIVALAFLNAALVVFWRKSNDWLAIFVSITLATFGATVTTNGMDYTQLNSPMMKFAVDALSTLGIVSFVLMLYIFPDGRFVPRKMKYVAIPLVAWAITWPIFPDFSIFHLTKFSVPIQFGAYVALFGTGVFAQTYRRACVATAIEKQQTRWIMSGLTSAFWGLIVIALLNISMPHLAANSVLAITLSLIGMTFYCLTMIAVPISISVSITHFRLWDLDPIIHRTMVYGALTALLGAFYIFDVTLFQWIFRTVTGQQSDLAIVASTLLMAAVFRPMQVRMKSFIDRRFYREKVDFRTALMDFAQEVRTIIDLPELLGALVNRISDLLHVRHVVLFKYSNTDKTFHIYKANNLKTEEILPLSVEPETMERLRDGLAVSQPQNKMFPLLVPLTAIKVGGINLVGVLALGSRLSGEDYSREDKSLLKVLAGQAGTAIYVAQLIMEKQNESRRREEAERYLEAHRNSPVGQAETMALTLMEKPADLLSELHGLAHKAGKDPETAILFSHLPKVLPESGGSLAESFYYLFASRNAPELLPLGMRTLVNQLESPHASDWKYSSDALIAYRLCQQALEIDCIVDIMQLLPALQEQETKYRDWCCTPIERQPMVFLGDLLRAITEFENVAESVYSYERVETPQDQIAYLVAAIERLNRINRIARTEMGGVDRPIVQRIAENWLAVVTTTMSDLQTRAQIVCRLLTRHTWENDVIMLALNIQNTGQGTALNLRVSLAPAPEYTLVDEFVEVEKLGPGEEAQVELRVRPRLANGVDQFRARFIIQYADPRGPDQIENFADVVYLLTLSGEFKYIPNPYVVGTPLQTRSPLFVGREDLVKFIQDNLAAAHRNNLVLIGQRRSGKTSLLKQLPARLGDDFLPIYLDGQTLGLDPGLANFFLTLATEISFAMDDRGLVIDPPALEDFIDSPVAAFEYKFLPKVREIIGQRHLLILFDEFEELESAVHRGNLDPSIFGFLRHLIQHTDKFSVIFCGTHRMEELASDYWHVLFNISLYKHIGFLSEGEALHLAKEPVAAYDMRYDDLALDKMWRVTSGHPYFLQLLCHSLVNRHNKMQRNYMTIADVNDALDEILDAGEAHFVYLWTESTQNERMVLTALSRIMPLTGHAVLAQISDYLAERGIQIERRAASEALHRLTMRDILRTDNESDVYRWRLGLLGLWVEKYKSVSRVVDEVH